MMVGAATALINDHKIGALLVVENKKPVGLVHFHALQLAVKILPIGVTNRLKKLFQKEK